MGKSIKWPLALIVTLVLIHNIVMTGLIGSDVSKLKTRAPYLETVAGKNCFVNQQVNQAATDFLTAPGKAAGLYDEAIVTLVLNLVPAIPIYIVSYINFRNR
mmetsp:Transcript_52111/g.59810  ORF Transcript_52111/g.59810 Transcript_52111/m.59810 type:complete len:102 (-) Transcript_52111:35-340(-)